MSSTNRGAIRIENDFYETPGWATRAILPLLGRPPSRVLEPNAGRGAILRELDDHWKPWETGMVIHAIEFDKYRAVECRVRGAGRWEVACEDYLGTIPGRYDLGMTNPTFEYAIPVVTRMLEECRDVVALLRLNMLGSQDRAPWWEKHPADVYVLPKRPSFCASLKCGAKPRGCGWKETLYLDAPRRSTCFRCGAPVIVTLTDSCEYAWFWWGPGRGNRWQVLQLVAP